MSSIVEPGTPVAAERRKSVTDRSLRANDLSPVYSRWVFLIPFTVILLFAFVNPPSHALQDLALLEHLASKIEHALTLSPETRVAIDRLLARQLALGVLKDPKLETRRQTVIERVTTAMKSKPTAPGGTRLVDSHLGSGGD